MFLSFSSASAVVELSIHAIVRRSAPAHLLEAITHAGHNHIGHNNVGHNCIGHAVVRRSAPAHLLECVDMCADMCVDMCGRRVVGYGCPRKTLVEIGCCSEYCRYPCRWPCRRRCRCAPQKKNYNHRPCTEHLLRGYRYQVGYRAISVIITVVVGIVEPAPEHLLEAITM